MGGDGDRFERRLRALLSSAPLIHFATAPDGIIRFSDGAGLKSLGTEPGQHVGRSVYELYGDSPWIVEGFRRAVEGEAGGAEGKMRGVWFNIQYIPLRDESGQVEEVVGIALNVQASHESEERYKRLASATSEGVLIHKRGTIIDCNQALSLMSGYEMSELVGMDGMTLFAVESRDEVRRHVAEENEEPYAAVGLRKDGSTYPGEVRGHNLTSGTKGLRVATIRDLTERARLLESERAARAVAEEALNLREEFISIASHELKTPLASLTLQLGRLGWLAEQGEVTPEVLKNAVEISLRQTKRLSRLVDDLFDVSRIRSGRLMLQREWLDLSEVVRDVLGQLRTELARTTSVVEWVAEAAVGFWDRGRIEQVVANLISNAIRYGLGRPLTIRVHPGERVRLTVSDQGVGIIPAAQARIFERYERAESDNPLSGLGLGLYIARQIVEAHGGTIQVTSKPGEGSVFTVELPAAREP